MAILAPDTEPVVESLPLERGPTSEESTPLLSRPVSMYKNAFSKEPKEVALGNILVAIRNGRWGGQVHRLRALLAHNREAYNREKRSLPAFAMSGTAQTRKGQQSHTGLIQVDLDHLGGDLPVVRDLVQADPHVAFGYVSPSGEGLKLGLRIDPDRHEESFTAAEVYFRERYAREIDKQVKDRLRLCFVSHDPGLWTREDAVPLPIPELTELHAPTEKPTKAPRCCYTPAAPTAQTNSDAFAATKTTAIPPGAAPTDLELTAALRRLPAENYSTWLAVGMALKDWDSVRGLALWDDWSRTSPKYQAGTCAAKWETFSGANAQGETVTAKTVLALAQAEDAAMVSRLAALDLAAYDRVREDEAKRAGLRTSVLDRMVEAKREHAAVVSTEGPVPPEAEPWSDPVNGAGLLSTITQTIKRFLVSGPMVPEILAIWSLHTYLTGASPYTPILALLSPEKRCGKSVALTLLSHLTRRPLVTANATPAALYRAIEAWRPTLLIDEFDSHSRDEAQVELRNILNSGFHRSGSVLRCEGEDSIPTPFTTFCPKAVASIGDLPETAMDRAIIIRLRRKLRTETTERLRKFDCPELRQQCVRWAADHAAILQDASPSLPEVLNDRQQDIWEPLLAIADQVGGDWPRILREAAVLIAGEQTDEGFGLMLLQDIDAIFADTGFDRIATSDLLERLNGLDERPWSTFAKGQPLTAHRLARLLKPYDVLSQSVRSEKQTFKGYYRDNFTEAWDRYLPAKGGFSKRNNVTTRTSIGENEGSESVTTDFCDGSKTTRIPNNDKGCDDVTVQKPEYPPRIEVDGSDLDFLTTHP